MVGGIDDAIVVALALRGAGPEFVREHWPGGPEGLRLVLQLAGYGAGTGDAADADPADAARRNDRQDDPAHDDRRDS